jgi:hypothetical protein
MSMGVDPEAERDGRARNQRREDSDATIASQVRVRRFRFDTDLQAMSLLASAEQALSGHSQRAVVRVRWGIRLFSPTSSPQSNNAPASRRVSRAPIGRYGAGGSQSCATEPHCA